MKESYIPQKLPIAYGSIDYTFFMEELIDATAALEVYMTKINDSKVDSGWFLPTLQQKEAISSSMLEGTQATLDGVLINQLAPSDEDKNINEVVNYLNATAIGFKRLKRGDFDDELFFDIHKTLLSGNVRKCTDNVGEYRKHQNYIGKQKTGELVYIPPKPDLVPELMENLISYMNSDNDKLRPLIRVAIVHAQFETIHPFGDGNGRVGRILIPLYLFAQNQISLPFFFISEALEKDKHKYYKLLMDIREFDKWNEWIKFFLETVAKQCRKYIRIIDEMNKLYEVVKESACKVVKSSSIIGIVDTMFRFPIFDAKTIQNETGISLATVNRYLNTLLQEGIIYTDGKKRNRNFFFYDLLSLIRD